MSERWMKGRRTRVHDHAYGMHASGRERIGSAGTGFPLLRPSFFLSLSLFLVKKREISRCMPLLTRQEPLAQKETDSDDGVRASRERDVSECECQTDCLLALLSC